jgi:hypothetical protein
MNDRGKYSLSQIFIISRDFLVQIQQLIIFQSAIVNAGYGITESTKSRPNVYEVGPFLSRVKYLSRFARL